MNRQDRNKKKSGNWIGLAIVLLFTAPQFVIPIGIFAGIVYLAVKGVQKMQHSSSSPRQIPAPKETSASFDECPQPLFCFHKDKGEHHVRRGKEIDPWDRPDIDISKYQRRQ